MNTVRMGNAILSVFLGMAWLLAGCAGEATQGETQPTVEVMTANTPIPPSPTNPPVTKTAAPTATTLAPAPPVEETAGLAALPAEPQQIAFKAGDGQDLVGRYYPGATNPAPLVVLMHWAPGDQYDWRAIAAWLQNRGLVQEGLGGQPWLDGSWFPPLPDGHSYGVFTFTFRNCEGGCKNFVRAAWLIDARAAMEVARQLEGVDPNRLVGIGASIGADGAIDGCIWLNTISPNSCQGALSLSPGDYLTVPYRAAVEELGGGELPKPAVCLYAEGDVEPRRSCEAAKGDHYIAVKYSGSDHGMTLIQPGSDPNPLQLILDFLADSIGS